MRKFLPYILILILVIFAGLFSPLANVQASGTCTLKDGTKIDSPDRRTCTEGGGGSFEEYSTDNPAPPGGGLYDGRPPEEQSAFEASIASCRLLTGGFDACLVKLSYYVFYAIPSWILNIAANFFNVIIAIALSSVMYSADFISEAWVVVRDLSNIFFILILLYIAFQTILGLSSHGGPKKMIAQVVIMALLINFSMFFTKVIIDSSNILALVFYNKVKVETVTRDGVELPKAFAPMLNGSKGVEDKDISGGLVSRFDPTKLMSEDFFTKVKERSQISWTATGLSASVGTGALLGNVIPVPGVGAGIGAIIGGVAYALSFIGDPQVPPAIMIGIILTAGSIMAFAAYAFLIASISFLGRLIELWILIIFSPFAFMSSVIPKLSNIEGIGWESWLKKLLAASFMAPIFMFFMYLIFKIVNTDIWATLAVRTPEEQGTIETIIFLIIPAMIILALLMKATEFAKKGGGQFGEAIMTGAKVMGGLAVGGAFLGGASLLKGSVGGFVKEASTGDSLANRVEREKRARITDPSYRDPGLGRINRLMGGMALKTPLPELQNKLGDWMNRRQAPHEAAREARHELDIAAGAIAPGKKWDELNGEQRYEARRKLARDRVVRNYTSKDTEGTLIDPVTRGAYGGFGTRAWDKLSEAERAAVDRQAEVGNDPLTGHAIPHSALAEHRTVDDLDFINKARKKQGLGDTILQSATTGTYDVRNLANLVMKEQSTGFTKLAMGLTGAMAMGMRGGFKQMGLNVGTAQGGFFKDLGNTISESLKSAKINVDLSHVGEEKKESDKSKHH